ncbi:glycosyltransferase family 4 protein [Caulobacter sp. ErkDOM-YI]|uniref:glycosyltransferase family 4 protein n=1 Tax=unclassified Caulobacter TaxID=2648921 RepID=UPI003AF6B090
MHLTSGGCHALKVGILDPLGRHGGLHYYTDGLATGLSESGIETCVYILDVTGEGEDKAYRSKVAFGGIYGGDPAWLRGLRFAKGLLRAFWDARANQIDIIHIHCFHYDIREILTAVLTILFGMKLVVTLHDIDSFGHSDGRLGRWSITRIARGLIVHNQFSLRAIRSGAKLSAPVAVIPHGHYVDAYPAPPERGAAREALGLQGDAFLALFFGNPRAEKGLDLLTDALIARPDLPIVLVVAGKMRPEKVSELQALGTGLLRGRLHVNGKHISDEDAEAYYRASNLVVVPYRRIYESGVTIMAQSFARAILCSDLPPLIASVGDTGRVFRAGDSESLSDALSLAYDDADNLDDLGQRGQEKAREERNWRDIGNATAKFYASL